MRKEVLNGAEERTATAFPRVTRRRFHALAGGVATLVAGGSALPTAVVGAQGVDLKTAPGAENLGVNEAFKAMAFGNASGAGWTRWTVQWFNVQREPEEFNDFYFTNEIGRAHV